MENCSFSQLNSISPALSWAPTTKDDRSFSCIVWPSCALAFWHGITFRVSSECLSEAVSGIAVAQGDHLLTSCCGLWFQLFCNCAAVSFCASSTHVKHHWQPALFRRKAGLLLTWTEPSICTVTDAISSLAINCYSVWFAGKKWLPAHWSIRDLVYI